MSESESNKENTLNNPDLAESSPQTQPVKEESLQEVAKVDYSSKLKMLEDALKTLKESIKEKKKNNELSKKNPDDVLKVERMLRALDLNLKSAESQLKHAKKEYELINTDDTGTSLKLKKHLNEILPHIKLKIDDLEKKMEIAFEPGTANFLMYDVDDKDDENKEITTELLRDVKDPAQEAEIAFIRLGFGDTPKSNNQKPAPTLVAEEISSTRSKITQVHMNENDLSRTMHVLSEKVCMCIDVSVVRGVDQKITDRSKFLSKEPEKAPTAEELDCIKKIAIETAKRIILNYKGGVIDIHKAGKGDLAFAKERAVALHAALILYGMSHDKIRQNVMGAGGPTAPKGFLTSTTKYYKDWAKSILAPLDHKQNVKDFKQEIKAIKSGIWFDNDKRISNQLEGATLGRDDATKKSSNNTSDVGSGAPGTSKKLEEVNLGGNDAAEQRSDNTSNIVTETPEKRNKSEGATLGGVDTANNTSEELEKGGVTGDMFDKDSDDDESNSYKH